MCQPNPTKNNRFIFIELNMTTVSDWQLLKLFTKHIASVRKYLNNIESYSHCFKLYKKYNCFHENICQYTPFSW